MSRDYITLRRHVNILLCDETWIHHRDNTVRNNSVMSRKHISVWCHVNTSQRQHCQKSKFDVMWMHYSVTSRENITVWHHVNTSSVMLQIDVTFISDIAPFPFLNLFSKMILLKMFFTIWQLLLTRIMRPHPFANWFMVLRVYVWETKTDKHTQTERLKTRDRESQWSSLVKGDEGSYRPKWQAIVFMKCQYNRDNQRPNLFDYKSSSPSTKKIKSEQPKE